MSARGNTGNVMPGIGFGKSGHDEQIRQGPAAAVPGDAEEDGVTRHTVFSSSSATSRAHVLSTATSTGRLRA